MTITGKFHIDVYNCDVHFILCDDVKKELHKIYKKHGETKKFPKEQEFKGFMYGPEDIDHYYLLICHEDFNHDIFNHEKSHLVEEMLVDRGIRARDEARCYLDGCISTKFNKLFAKKKLKLK